jgi:hypothetical protein
VDRKLFGQLEVRDKDQKYVGTASNKSITPRLRAGAFCV